MSAEAYYFASGIVMISLWAVLQVPKTGYFIASLDLIMCLAQLPSGDHKLKLFR